MKAVKAFEILFEKSGNEEDQICLTTAYKDLAQVCQDLKQKQKAKNYYKTVLECYISQKTKEYEKQKYPSRTRSLIS